MKKVLRIIIPIILVLAIVLCTAWYLFIYDRPFTRDVLLNIARYSESHGNHGTAAWFYSLAYTHSGNSDSVAIELAEQYKSIGNFTKAEYTLTNAIEDGGGIDLYIALCKTFVEQDKLLDAVNMLNSIEDPAIKQEIEKLRPQSPAVSPAPGLYNEYISVAVSGNDGTVYATHNGQYPSVHTQYTNAFSLVDGENTIQSICIADNGLASSLSTSSYMVGGVVKEMVFTDSTLEKAIRSALSVESDAQLFTNDLWVLQTFTVPKNVKSINDLQYMSFLEKLTIDAFDGDDLSCIASLNTLNELYISNTMISQETLTTIAAIPNLQYLTLSNCSLSGIKPLESATKLVSLDLSNNALRTLDPLSTLTKLQNLNLSHNAIANLSALSSLPTLTVLNVSHNALTTLAPITSVTTLKELNAAYNSITDLGQFDRLTALTHLSLEKNQISNIDVIGNCTNMEELNLASNGLTDISALSSMVQLTTLDFSFNEVKSLPDFAAECTLVTINGSNNKLTNLDELGGLSHLNTVNMDYNAKISSVKALADCPLLILVNVYGTKVKDVSMLTELNIIVNYKPV